MMQLTINIPDPCTENWDDMDPTSQGKHCASCNKTVIDFSGMTDAQIIKILLEQKGKKICGNFYNTQLKKPMLYAQQRSFPKWPAIAAMLVAGLFQLNSGTANAQQQQNPTLYSRTLAFEKKPEMKSVLKTEPGSDSLLTYTISVFDEKTKEKLTGISVEIDSLGTFTTDGNGQVKLSLELDKVPKIVRIQLSGWNYEVKDLAFAKSRLMKSKNMHIYLKESERMMLRGDIDINYHGN